MATEVRHRKGTTAEHAAFTGASAEITVDTTKKTAVVHDGSTAGGIPMKREDAGVAIVRVQKFTSSGTYTPDSKMLYCEIECIGAGGGGGGAISTTAGTVNGAGGGGAGARAVKLATKADIGASKAVTIGAAGTAGAAGNNAGGAGGDTSVGTLCVAKGGSPGSGAAAGAGASAGLGGTAGSSVGDIVAPGQNGVAGRNASIATVFFNAGGAGGNSPYGAGGPPTATGNGGIAGNGNGAGGAGGSDINAGGNRAGGVGTAGIVIIKEFCWG
ncbi:hypothetical protein EHH54_05835 [Rhizobium leguminosarum]|uniref:hyaluronate lyase N-terminal domain-containing protein n=1 Tax=Rhizobium leguminosarum TaxID=384 RepID=UPI000FEC8604|nr:hypothetical protein [Rhizobium leguminosarum]RWX41668.1 hypothetical protein EHH54_05835 [Rhizobium leguminosarum]